MAPCPRRHGGWRLGFFGSNLNGFTLNSWSLQFTGSELTTQTDASGNYSFNDLPAGNINVAVANSSMSPNPQRTVTVPASGMDIGVAVPHPDLAGTTFTVDAGTSPVDWGGTVTVRYTITNRGPGDAARSTVPNRLGS